MEKNNRDAVREGQGGNEQASQKKETIVDNGGKRGQK